MLGPTFSMYKVLDLMRSTTYPSKHCQVCYSAGLELCQVKRAKSISNTPIIQINLRKKLKVNYI